MTGRRPAALPRPPVALAVLAALVALAAVAPLVVHALTRSVDLRQVDLAVYRDGGRSVLRGGSTLYRHVTRDHLPFTYPPFAALLSVPLAWLPFSVDEVLWSLWLLVLTTALAAVGFAPVLRRAGRWWPLLLAALAVAVAYLLPFRDELKFAQVDEWLALLCVAACLMCRPRWPRGLLVGLATAVKLTPGVFVVYLFLTGRRRAAGVAVGAFALATGVSAAVLPHESADFWTHQLLHPERLRSNAGTSNQSLRGMLLRLGLPAHVQTAVWVAAVVVVAVVGYRRAVAAHAAGNERAGIALVGLLAVLLSPVAWIHHLAWLPLVLGVVLYDGRDRCRQLAAAALWLFFALRLPWYGVHLLHYRPGVPHALSRLLQDSFGLMALALVATLPVRPPPAPPSRRPAQRTARPPRSARSAAGPSAAGSGPPGRPVRP